jgi:dTDP-4-amino-4,6-dideoxygalactose transaminase
MSAYLPFTRPCIDEATIDGVADVLRSGWITSGPQVKAFEAALSEYFGGRPVRAFNSGTCTMEIALRIAGIAAGAEVITTPLSWVATSNVVLAVGARPVFVDIDPATRNIDLARIEAAITPATRAIIPVDIAGLPVNRDELYAIAKRRHLRVVEDAAQSLGSHWGGSRIGAIGDFVSLSFHPNKNATSIEGGCLVMNDSAEALLAEKYRLQGVVRSGFDGMECDLVGGKFNLTDVAARVGLGQLKQLAAFNARRQALARAYFAGFESAGSVTLGLQLQLAHVPGGAAGGTSNIEARAGDGRDARSRDRHRSALPRHSPLCPLPPTRLESGGFPTRRIHWTQHSYASTVSGDAGRRRRTGY